MAEPRRPEGVKLFVGLIAGDGTLFAKVRKVLEDAFRNRIDFESDALDFDHTDYYRDEMGPGLKRKFFGFDKTLPPGSLYKMKLKTNRIEKMFSRGGKRMINIDPGYLDLSKMVLFSTKDYSHRVYLDKGIFAEVTLFYRNNTYSPWPWTYKDYSTSAYIEIFNRMRENFKRTRCATYYTNES